MRNWRRPILGFYDTHVTRNPVPNHVAFLADFYTLPIAQRRSTQMQQLKHLLLHAARNVPYYGDLLRDAGVVYCEQVDLTRFSQIPELTRDHLHSDFEGLKSRDYDTRAWYKNGSGGSSGIPVVVLQDRCYDDIGRATQEMLQRWAGWESGEPFVTLWGSERDVLRGTSGWRNKLSNFIRNRTFLNSWCMSKVDLERYAKILQRARPVMIEAYAESIYELARYINDSGIKVTSVRGVVTSAGTLYPFIREEVERAFGCPVLNRYGSREVGSFAGERVSGGGMEVFSYTHFVEVVNERGQACKPGEEGEVLVTCMTNYTMPIIRYRIGDRAVVGASTESPTPSVENLHTVTGRIMDTFVREDGSTVPGNFFMHFLGKVHNDGWLKKTQVIQTDYNSILIKLIIEAPPPPIALEEIRTSFRRVMGDACQVEFEIVDSIPPLPSGKYRYAVSLVQHPRLRHSYPLSSFMNADKIAS
jgi:phenylacetate-CoA ligase